MDRRLSRGLRRSLNVESLERRSLLAGNITAAVTDGTLLIRGDDAANGVIIRMAPRPEGATIDPNNPPPIKLEIVGVKAGDAATTVNGGTAKFVAEGVTKGVVVELGKGNDALTIANPPPPKPAEGEPLPPPPPPVALPGNVRINLGEGNDRFGGSIGNRAGVGIVLGPGNDGLNLRGSRLNNLHIFGDVPPPPPNSGTSSAISADETTDLPPLPPPGSDHVELVNTHVAGTALIDTAIGNDVVLIQGRSGFDKGLNINTGDGNDGVQLLGLPPKEGKPAVPVVVQGGLQINLGGGDDRLNLAGVSVIGVVSVNAGAGNDVVNFAGVRARDGLFAALGAGNDKLSVGGSASKTAKFSGGDGTDLYTDRGGNHFESLVKEGFEDPPAT